MGKIRIWETLENFFASQKGRIVFKLCQLIVGIWIGTMSLARYVRNNDNEIVNKENEYLRIKLEKERDRCDSLQRADIINYLKIQSLKKKIKNDI